MIVNEEEYIEHHGIKGQRWGIRRYQNPDGSLTEQGKRHQLLKSFDSQKITKESLKDFSNQYKQLSHVRISNNTDGKLYSKNGKLVGMINTEQKDDGHVWIQGLEVFGDNQGRGLGTALLDEAVTNLNADRLSVNKNNIKAKRLYDKYGFDTYDQDDTMYYMEISARHSFNSNDCFDLTDVLSHHGIKGQCWGVQNGPPYPIGRSGQTLSNGNAKLLKNYKGPAYFVSEKKFEDTHLTPRVPNNYMTKHGFEDSETPRVSFAPTIEQCLAGLSQNLDDKTFYVYEPVDISKCEVYKPNNKAVPDSDITNELWVTNPVDIRPVKKIKITGNKGEDGKEYSYGQDKAILFDDWTFEAVD